MKSLRVSRHRVPWLCLLLAASCQTRSVASPAPAPIHVRPFRIDADASEVAVSNAVNAEAVKRIAIDAIHRSLGVTPQNASTIGVARMRLEATVDAKAEPFLGIVSWVPGFVVFAPMWMPVGYVEVTARLRLDANGALWRGTAKERRDLLCLAAETDRWYDEAVFAAVQAAFADAMANADK